MNRKKIIAFLLILIIIALAIYFICTHISLTKNAPDEYSNYTPEEEITEEKANETTITLYFVSEETNKIKSEIRLVSINDLLKNPYKLIVENLINGPIDSKLKSVFPENTRIIDASLTNNCVILNFSDDLLNFSNDTQKFNIINTLLNSLTQLTEVNSIKILINNNPHEGIDQEYSVISENT